MIGEIVIQIVGEIVGYATGRLLLSVFTPHIRIARLSASSRPPKQGRFALTYTRNGHRYYFDEAVTATGVLFWLVVIIAVSVAWSR